MIERLRNVSGETVHRLPVAYRGRLRGRGGPIPHHVPAGPVPLGWSDPSELMERAEQRAREDAGAPVHDAVSLGHDALLLFEREVEDRRTEDTRWMGQLEQTDLMMAEAIREGAAVRARSAEGVVDTLGEEIAGLDAAVSDGEAELRGDPPYEESRWRAPERVAEPFWRYIAATWGVVAVLLPVELGINMLALQFLDGSDLERFSFAVVVGMATLWAGHAAGGWMAERRAAGRVERAAVPVGLALLVVAVTVLMAALRVALVQQPETDPITGEQVSSTLTSAGVPGFVVWAGIAAIQLIFFAVTVLHAARVHNPRASSLQWARRRRRRLHRQRARAANRVAEAHAEAGLATSHRAAVVEMWSAKHAERSALFDQVADRYLQELARALADPEATVSLEARAARRPAAPARYTTPHLCSVHRGTDISTETDTETDPPGRVA